MNELSATPMYTMEIGDPSIDDCSAGSEWSSQLQYLLGTSSKVSHGTFRFGILCRAEWHETRGEGEAGIIIHVCIVAKYIEGRSSGKKGQKQRLDQSNKVAMNICRFEFS